MLSGPLIQSFSRAGSRGEDGWSLRPSVCAALKLGQVLRAVGALGEEFVVQLTETGTLRVAARRRA
jgi:hypothetical protein